MPKCVTLRLDSRPHHGLVAVALLLALAGCGSAHRTVPKTLLFVVSRGTTVKVALGHKVEIMPARLELRVGDVVRIRNDDGLRSRLARTS
jgi:hypothetical protein